MVTREQLYSGIAKYIDNEVIPKLPTSSKWAIGTALILSAGSYNDIFNKFFGNNMVQALGIVSQDGLIDNERLATALSESANKYGKISFNIPLVGVLTFSNTDIDALNNYIRGGNT